MIKPLSLIFADSARLVPIDILEPGEIGRNVHLTAEVIIRINLDSYHCP